MRTSRLIICVLILGLLAGILQAQRRRSSWLFNLYDKDTPTEEFAIARWYSSGWVGDGWAHDYPNAEEHILQIVSEVSLIQTNRLSYKAVDMASDEIFEYPFAYISHPGEVFPSDQEIENLRQYIDRGGFIMVDDFGGQGQGPWEFENFRKILRRAFPERELYPLTDQHELLRISYTISNLDMIHPMSGAKSTFYGFDDGKGRLAMVVCYANDVGDYWEFLDQPRYPLKPSSEAVRLGINIIMYALTH
jgi:hypothetical protein